MNILKTRKPITLSTFLKEASAQGSGIKYTAEKGKQHRLYIPSFTYTDEEGNVQTSLIAEMHQIHEWKDGDKFHSAECTKDKFGTCPFCDRVQDAWNIYNERVNAATEQLKAQGLSDSDIQYRLKGEQDKEKRKQPNAYKGLCTTYADERKMKEVKSYLYLLVAQYEVNADNTEVVEKGMPKYALKVWKMPEGRVQTLSNTFASAGGMVQGNEVTIQYKDFDDKAQLVGQSTPAAVFPQYAWITKYPGLKEKIDAEAAAFDMESISKSFEELRNLEPDACKALANSGFAKWDAYKAELALNPGAKYLEYANVAATNMPSIGGSAQGMTFALPGQNAPTMQQAPVMQQPAPTMQQAPVQTPEAPTLPPTTPTQLQPTQAPADGTQQGAFNFHI